MMCDRDDFYLVLIPAIKSLLSRLHKWLILSNKCIFMSLNVIEIYFDMKKYSCCWNALKK